MAVDFEQRESGSALIILPDVNTSHDAKFSHSIIFMWIKIMNNLNKFFTVASIFIAHGFVLF